jgi:DNA-binding CsgD family transcriptional regulator
MSATLTPAVFEVLELSANGHTNRSIARRLGKAIETVKTQRRQAIAQLEARGMAHAVALALVHGVTVQGEPRQVRIARELEPEPGVRQQPFPVTESFEATRERAAVIAQRVRDSRG